MKSIRLTVLFVCAVIVNTCGQQEQNEIAPDEDPTDSSRAPAP